MADEEAHRDPERPTDSASRAVAPGALSALLYDLAHVSDEPIEGGAPQPGAVIGRFEILRRVGGGGFGVVYEARDRELHRSVAFKLVRPGRLEAGEGQLGREAEVIAQLSHPNLVTLFDVGRCQYGPYLVLELLRGGTLEQRLRQGPIPLAEAIRVATEISRGLAHAHGQGVVHRDLKPSNVFLCQEGQVKILDFGMSHAFGRRRVSGGTPGYMAPEQWSGAPEDERTDVYALGAMLFEMLTGKLPFPTSDGGKAVMSDRRAPAVDVPGRAAVGALVARMLEKDATQRPRDASEVLALLAVNQEQGALGPGGPGSPLPKVRPRRGRRVWALGAAGVVAVVAVGVAAARLWRAGAPPTRAIVVLPFANVSDSPENEYLSDGLTEEILHRLTRVRELKVAARGSSFYFKHRKVEIADVARRLGVDVVLEGSVRRDRDRLRIGAELVDARSGFRIWSQTYDRRLEDVFAVQDDIAQQVVAALELVLSRASQTELRKPRAASVAAYDLYLRARAHLRVPSSEESLARAAELLQQVIAADPGFAQAYAAQCEAWLARYELARATERFDRAEAACGEALSRDREAGEVYVALGNLHVLAGRYEQAERELQHAITLPSSAVDALLGLARAYTEQHRLDEAERTLDRAAELDPGYWRVHRQRGNFFLQNGRYAEAARSYSEEIARTPDDPAAHNNLGAAYYAAGDLERADQAWRASLELAPTSSAYSNVGTSAFYLGRFAEAAGMYERAVELSPGDHRLWGNLADAYACDAGREAAASGAYQRAVALARERLRVNPADAEAVSDLAHYHARLGHADEARRLAADALKLDPKSAYVHYNAALVYARLGGTDAALDEIERAVALGYQRHLLPLDPGLRIIREHRRFTALLSPGTR